MQGVRAQNAKMSSSSPSFFRLARPSISPPHPSPFSSPPSSFSCPPPRPSPSPSPPPLLFGRRPPKEKARPAPRRRCGQATSHGASAMTQSR
eukprot:9466595-Pyramimonas_sp.AAC.1